MLKDKSRKVKLVTGNTRVKILKAGNVNDLALETRQRERRHQPRHHLKTQESYISVYKNL